MTHSEPPPLFISAIHLDSTVIALSAVILLLLLLSALFSGAESAYFSLSPKDTEALAQETTSSENKILKLLKQPKELLAALLIANNFVNVGIIILSSYLINYYFPMAENYLRFFLEVIGITLLILIWGEVIPKIFAVKNATFVSKLMSTPIIMIKKTPPFSFLVRILVRSSRLFDQTKKGKVNLSSSDLEQAVAITKEESPDDEHNILEGIVKFGKTEASQIMKPRIEVSAVDAEMKFSG
jgi:Mg2+/Co2+ transporter CorB